MISEKKKAAWAIGLIFCFYLGASLFLNIQAIQSNFLFADEATYYSLTQSIAQDGDLEYTKKDLYRYYKSFDSGPLGIFLKKGKGDKIYFAKSFAYSLFAAPFVKILGANGFLVFHSILLALMLWMGWTYFSIANKPLFSLGFVLTFLFASVACVYFIWMQPDFFNLFLVFTILFLWLYKHKHKEQQSDIDTEQTDKTFIHSVGSDILAAVLAGIAVYSKPSNIVLMVPIILFYFFRKKIIRPLLIGGVFVLTAGIFFGTNYLITGDWNYQGGERKSFYGIKEGYPLEKEGITFDSIKAGTMSTEGYSKRHLLPPKFILYNLFYYFFGRHTGITWYFFPAILAIILFFIRRKRFDQWLLFGTLTVEILLYLILMPDNYAGGGGALANRYFLSIYPLFLFLPSIKRNIKESILCWAVAALFLAPILTNPIIHSHYPATHAKKLPFTLLPVEMTLVNNFPTNTNPNARRQAVGMKYSWIYFLDDNFIPRQEKSELEKFGFWTRGSHAAEMILKTYYPIKSLTVHLLNNPRMRNKISVKVGRDSQTLSLGHKQRGTLTFTSLKPFCIKALHLYKIRIKASKGSIPYFEDRRSLEKRNLGVFFEFKIEPEYMPEY